MKPKITKHMITFTDKDGSKKSLDIEGGVIGINIDGHQRNIGVQYFLNMLDNVKYDLVIALDSEKSPLPLS